MLNEVSKKVSPDVYKEIIQNTKNQDEVRILFAKPVKTHQNIKQIATQNILTEIKNDLIIMRDSPRMLKMQMRQVSEIMKTPKYHQIPATPKELVAQCNEFEAIANGSQFSL